MATLIPCWTTSLIRSLAVLHEEHVIGVAVFHVDDLFVTGNDELHSTIPARLRKDFQIGPEDIQNVAFTGQRVRWMKNVLVVSQDKAVEELSAIPVESHLKG